jgi:hypothetical protein
MDTFFIAGLTTFALGAAMAIFAWTVVRQNRQREAARVALLSGLAFQDGVPAQPAASRFDAIAESVRRGPDEFLSEHTQVVETDALFREPEKSAAASRRMAALGAVAAVMLLGVATFKLFSSATVDAPSAPAAAQKAAPVAPAVAAPEARVELLALDHANTPAGLIVTGRLRNPVGGASLHDVVAVVDVLDRSGRVLTTARASVERDTLNAGDWSDFSVATKKTSEVARYRVVFHAKERESVPQIDRRGATDSRSE